MCDVALDIKGERLLAHRLILSACSPYLKTCCISAHSNPEESLTEIKIPNCSYKVCLKTLEYLYTGRTVDLPELPVEEFDNLCKEWELKQPLGAPVINISSLQNSDDRKSPPENSVPFPSISDQSERHEHGGSDSVETGTSVLSGEIPNNTPQPEPTPVVGRKTRLTCKRNASSISSKGRTTKRRKTASSKVLGTKTSVKEEETSKGQSNSVSDDNSNLSDYAESFTDNDSSWENDTKCKKTPKRNQKKLLPTKTTKPKADKNISSGRPRGRPRKYGQGTNRYAATNKVNKSRAFVCRQCKVRNEYGLLFITEWYLNQVLLGHFPCGDCNSLRIFFHLGIFVNYNLKYTHFTNPYAYSFSQ